MRLSLILTLLLSTICYSNKPCNVTTAKPISQSVNPVTSRTDIVATSMPIPTTVNEVVTVYSSITTLFGGYDKPIITNNTTRDTIAKFTHTFTNNLPKLSKGKIVTKRIKYRKNNSIC